MDEPLIKAFQQAQANLKLSGFTITEEQKYIVNLRLEGKISEEEFQKKVLELVKQKK